MEPLFARLDALTRGAIAHVPQVVLSVVVVLLTWVISRVAARVVVQAVKRAKPRQSVQELIANLTSLGIWCGGLVTAATVLFPSLTPGKIVAGLGLGSVALGFAFKDVFENFFAGIVILLRDVIEIGDFVEADGWVGRVEQISIRDTHVRTVSGERVILPNGVLFKSPIRVLTDTAIRRLTAVVGVDYEADHDLARKVIRETLKRCDTPAEGQPVEVLVQGMGASSVDFELTWWAGSTPVEQRRSRGEVLGKVKSALDRAGISIPFPHRTLTFKEPLRLEAPEQVASLADGAR